MKKFAFILLLISPVLSWAQTDDMYFVPKKEKKVLVVKSAEEVYFAEDCNTVVEDVDTTADITYVENAYFTNDLYGVVDDYAYSNRIIRFQSPRRLFSSSLYWDLMYDCGINDWFVYDTGYALYIYPTANNLYYTPYNGYWMNRWNWNRYYAWNYPCYDNWYYYDFHWNRPHWGCVGSGNISRPSYHSGNIPTNGRFATTRGVAYPSRGHAPGGQPSRTPTETGSPRREQPTRTVVGSNPRREQPVRTTVEGNTNPRREQQTRTQVAGSNPRREQQTRTQVAGSTPRREQQVRTDAGNFNPRREQQTRTSVNSYNSRSVSSGSVSRQQYSRTSVNSSNARRAVSSGGSGVTRSSGSNGGSSGGYNRPSSTGASRSYSSSSSSYSSGSSSSYSSGSGASFSSGGGGGRGGGRSGGSR